MKNILISVGAALAVGLAVYFMLPKKQLEEIEEDDYLLPQTEENEN